MNGGAKSKPMTEEIQPPLSPIARGLVDQLKPHTPFAEAIVRRQAERAGVQLATMEQKDLVKVVPLLLAAASTFVDPVVLQSLKARFGPR